MEYERYAAPPVTTIAPSTSVTHSALSVVRSSYAVLDPQRLSWLFAVVRLSPGGQEAMELHSGRRGRREN